MSLAPFIRDIALPTVAVSVSFDVLSATAFVDTNTPESIQKFFSPLSAKLAHCHPAVTGVLIDPHLCFSPRKQPLQSMVNRTDVPQFPVVARRFMEFVGTPPSATPFSFPASTTNTTQPQQEQESDQVSVSTSLSSGKVLLVVHNGQRFDAPFLASEFARAGLDLPQDWLFCDSLHVSASLRWD